MALRERFAPEARNVYGTLAIPRILLASVALLPTLPFPPNPRTVMMRKGRLGLYETVVIRFEWPIISPTLLPVSHMKHLALHCLPSPTTTMRFDSGSQSRSMILPLKAGTSTLRMCSGLSHDHTRTFPVSSDRGHQRQQQRARVG